MIHDLGQWNKKNVDGRDTPGHDGSVGVGRIPFNLDMPRLVPGIHALQSKLMQGGWVYIVTNEPNGILYTGVTRAIAKRVWQHRQGTVSGFTRRYGLKRLVWCEAHQTMVGAIQREKNIKHWPRAWKVRLILAANPDWDDLYERLNQ